MDIGSWICCLNDQSEFHIGIVVSCENPWIGSMDTTRKISRRYPVTTRLMFIIFLRREVFYLSIIYILMILSSFNDIRTFFSLYSLRNYRMFLGGRIQRGRLGKSPCCPRIIRTENPTAKKRYSRYISTHAWTFSSDLLSLCFNMR